MKLPKFPNIKKAAKNPKLSVENTKKEPLTKQNANGETVLYVDAPEEIPIEKPDIKNPNIDLYLQSLSVPDVVAPKKAELDFTYVKIGNTFFRTIFVGGYPRFVSAGWLEPIINFDGSLDISFFVYPVEGKAVLDDLRRKIAEMEAEISVDIERGKIVDPSTQAKLEDAIKVQELLVKGAERFFEFSFYITIPAATVEELETITKQVQSTLGSLLIVSKNATLDMDSGFISTSPFGIDKVSITP